jgi:hypothetical protein
MTDDKPTPDTRPKWALAPEEHEHLSMWIARNPKTATSSGSRLLYERLGLAAARIAELEAENARLREALNVYGEHSRECRARSWGDEHCDCGFAAVRSVRPGQEEAAK